MNQQYIEINDIQGVPEEFDQNDIFGLTQPNLDNMYDRYRNGNLRNNRGMREPYGFDLNVVKKVAKGAVGALVAGGTYGLSNRLQFGSIRRDVNINQPHLRSQGPRRIPIENQVQIPQQNYNNNNNQNFSNNYMAYKSSFRRTRYNRKYNNVQRQLLSQPYSRKKFSYPSKRRGRKTTQYPFKNKLISPFYKTVTSSQQAFYKLYHKSVFGMQVANLNTAGSAGIPTLVPWNSFITFQLNSIVQCYYLQSTLSSGGITPPIPASTGVSYLATLIRQYQNYEVIRYDITCIITSTDTTGIPLNTCSFLNTLNPLPSVSYRTAIAGNYKNLQIKHLQPFNAPGNRIKYRFSGQVSNASGLAINSPTQIGQVSGSTGVPGDGTTTGNPKDTAQMVLCISDDYSRAGATYYNVEVKCTMYTRCFEALSTDT